MLKNNTLSRSFILINFIIALFSFQVKAQSDTGEKDEIVIPEASNVLLNEKNKTVKLVQLKKGAVAATDHLVWINANIKPKQQEISLELFRRETDQNGYIHNRYKQYYKGVKVEYGVLYAHILADELVSVNGELYPEINLSIQPAFDKKEAFKKALASIQFEKYQYTDATGNPVLRDSIEMLIYPGKQGYKLAYKVDVYSAKPLKRSYVYIDAQTGENLYTEDRIHHTDVTGTAQTGHNGNVTMTTDQVGAGNFRLRANKGFGGVATFNMLNGTNYGAAIDFTDADNVWDSPGLEKYAYDAHFGAESTYEYYKTRYGRNSYDNAGASINSYVHYDVDYDNAFWNGSEMTYGDGNGSAQSFPLTSIDIIGHEITHAVTEYSAGLVYADESGGLNESFSDCFGVAVDYYKNPASANFLMGEQANGTGTAFRNMADPNQYDNPDTYNGMFWNAPNEVHNNSGVQNYWFYLLSMGGSGINDIGHAFNVTPLGIDVAANIAYRNLSVYLTPNSTYDDARIYAILAAADLYGNCSNEVAQVTNAWYAVGLGTLYQPVSKADFKAENYSSCQVPSNIQFRNLSINADTYSWDFGDGNTSSQFEPIHTYMAQGVYTVQLTASSASCGPATTIVKNDFITVYDGSSPISATCTAKTSSYCCGVGIVNVSFGSINRSSVDGVEGYQDLTCSQMTTVELGEIVPLQITSGLDFSEDVFAWIDYNNDGSFDNSSELVLESYSGSMSLNGSVQIPATAVTNTPLRMRVMSDFSGISSFACDNPVYGQAEDFTVKIVPATPLPIADFVADQLVVDVGTTINYTDYSKNAPTTWRWYFAGGTPSVSTDQNPAITYNAVGVYPAKLVVSNSFGADSLTKSFYITVQDLNLMCVDAQSSSTNGILFDSGGENGNYKSSEKCSFLINPPCVESISLNFSSFETQMTGDSITVRDANGQILLKHSGTAIPAALSTTTGSLKVDFKSNFGFNMSGFKANWTSTPIQFGVTDFSWIADANNGVAFQVLETGVNDNTYSWNFGDLQSSTDKNPSHVYADNSCYDVELTVSNPLSVCTQKLNHSFCLDGTGKPSVIKIYPNPSSGLLSLEVPNLLEKLEIHDVLGQRVSYEIEKITDYQYVLDLRILENAPYFITVNEDVLKIVKYND